MKSMQNKKLKKKTKKVLDEALKGKNMSKSYDNMNDFWKSLNVKSK